MLLVVIAVEAGWNGRPDKSIVPVNAEPSPVNYRLYSDSLTSDM